MNKIIDCKKFYYRTSPGSPDTEMMAYAARGFWFHGCETKSYMSLQDIFVNEDLGPEVGVAGWIQDVKRSLTHMGITPPNPIDYPQELTEFFGRNIWKSQLKNLQFARDPVFVKPILSQKLFTGFVFKKDNESESLLASFEPEIGIWCSDPVKFVSEHRAFVLDGEILDCRLYTGDWSKAPDKVVVEAALEAVKPIAPRSFSLDFGITDEGKTLVVEMNDGFALGHYGLRSDAYARLLSARWNEMVTNGNVL
jgi:ATP-grasp domain-containing protein